MKKRILTGDRPTGKLHVGHFVGTLQNRAKLQDEYEQFVMIANVQALTDNFDNPEKVKQSIGELLCDYYSVGIDFSKTTVFIQSEVPQIHEIFVYLSNFVSIQQISHNPTIKTEIAEKKFDASTPLGFFMYPIHQAGDILCVNADLVPVGPDQLPMIESTRELARKFNNTYGVKALNEPEGLVGIPKNLPGIDGNAKMGKSLGNAIYLSDSESELKKKVMKMYTDPNRIRATDPGEVDGNPVFIYHDIFNDNEEEVEDLKNRYLVGKVGDVEVKEKLFVAMNKVLTPIREKRAEAEKIKGELLESAIEGSKKVREIASGVVVKMKKAMKIDFPISEKYPAEKVEFLDFKKLDIRIGEIIGVERLVDTEKLLKFEISFGGETRQIIAGMANHFEDLSVLVGKKVPVLKNLEFKKLAGYESQGMIVAADERGKPVFLIPESEIELNSIVK